MSSTQSVSVASPLIQQQNTPSRLLESINLLPGSKMEERSPGTFRLSVRGSTLRSPFGVRNVKIYLDDFILSDVSGNTYLNVIDPALIAKTEILKGQQGGEFGAVTGGTVLLKTRQNETTELALHGGSFGFFKESFDLARKSDKHFIQLFQSFHTTESYREQSAFKRGSLFLKDRWNYSENGELNFTVLYSDLHYETPGGLTLAQMLENRRQSRPKTATLPSAAQQDAGIYNKFFMAGVSHKIDFGKNFSHFIAVQSAFSGLKNPFITNFEKRQESNYAVRTHFNFEKERGDFFVQSRLGFEGGVNSAIIGNFDNNSGDIGDAQNFTNISTRGGFGFFSQKLVYGQKLFVDAALSANFLNYNWENTFLETDSGKKFFKTQYLPDFGVTWLIKPDFSVRAKIGKGNSYPTLEEFRSSNQIVNPNLNAEFGWNKEIGVRKQFGNFLFTEVSLFDFRLKNAIVRRQNEAGQEYFLNAGGTVQKGIEIVAETKNFRLKSFFLNAVKLYVSGSFYDFSFDHYQQNDNDFSANRITGVPSNSFQGLLSLQIFRFMDVDYVNYFTSEFPLNDANTFHAEKQFYGNLTVKFDIPIQKKNLNFYIQIQNLYNNDLVLGYDINAFGNRFYNPSASRNFSVGTRFQF